MAKAKKVTPELEAAVDTPVVEAPVAAVEPEVKKAFPKKAFPKKAEPKAEAPDVKKEVLAALEPFLKAGLQVKLNDHDSTFEMRAGNKSDSGTLKQPIGIIVKCARRLIPAVQA